MGRLAVTEELHAKQEAARKEAERAARKAPQDAAADAKGAGEPASKKGSGEPGDVLGKTPPYQQTRATGEPSSSWLPLPSLSIRFRSSARVFRSSASRSARNALLILLHAGCCGRSGTPTWSTKRRRALT